MAQLVQHLLFAAQRPDWFADLWLMRAAVCRHLVGIGAVNLVKCGERFAYTHALEMHRVFPLAPSVIYQDVACKHQPWQLSMLDKVQASADPELASSDLAGRVAELRQSATTIHHVLPDAHGQGHSWACQVSAWCRVC